MPKKKIVIFGGSFNPPHAGHKAVIELVRTSYPWDEVWLMPSGDRADKTMAATKEQRLKMAELFKEDMETNIPNKTIAAALAQLDIVSKTADYIVHPPLFISTLELDREKPTTTIDTLHELEEKSLDTEFYFALTTETIPGIKKFWEGGEELFERGNFVILERPGSEHITTIELPPKHIIVDTSEARMPKISSTDIRAMKTREEALEFMSEPLVDYLMEEQLYGFGTKE